VPAALEPIDTVADLIHGLGDIPPERILWNPIPGTATEADALNRKDVELIDGVLVQRSLHFRKGLAVVPIGCAVLGFARQHRLGITCMSSGPFRIRPGLVFRPSVGYVAWSRVMDGIPDMIDGGPGSRRGVADGGQHSRGTHPKIRRVSDQRNAADLGNRPDRSDRHCDPDRRSTFHPRNRGRIQRRRRFARLPILTRRILQRSPTDITLSNRVIPCPPP